MFATSPQEAIIVASTSVVTSMLHFIPILFAAVLIFVIGLFLARLVKLIVKKILETIKLSTLVKDTGVNTFLKKADITKNVEEVIGEVARWLVILIFSIATVNILGLVTVSEFLTNILGYIPRVISAALILTVGVLVAGWVESLVKGAVGTFSVSTGRLLGKVSSYTIVIFTILAAISELGIAEQFINILFIGFIAMVALALGLSIGLGAKDVVSEVLRDWYKQLKKDLN